MEADDQVNIFVDCMLWGQRGTARASAAGWGEPGRGLMLGEVTVGPGHVEPGGL